MLRPPVYQQTAARAKSAGFGGMMRQMQAAAPQRLAGGVESIEEEEELGDFLSMPAAAPAPLAEIAQASISSSGGGTSPVTYRVEKPIAVPSDGTPHKTTVTVLNLSVKLDYLTVPKLADRAYLRAPPSVTPRKVHSAARFGVDLSRRGFRRQNLSANHRPQRGI
ncbi:MAG: hypothetical protein U0694_18330 [Anaerolineae bacterium]